MFLMKIVKKIFFHATNYISINWVIIITITIAIAIYVMLFYFTLIYFSRTKIFGDFNSRVNDSV